MNSGIYRWLCIPTGKKYIGRAVNLERRYRQFLNFNSRYSGKSDKIEGVDAAREMFPDPRCWEYKVLIECDRAHLNYREKMCISINQTAVRGYNQTKGGTTGTDGYKHTEATRKVLSEKVTAFQATIPEAVRKQRAIHASSFVDRSNPEYRKHLSEALMGHIETEDTRAKIREGQRDNMKVVLRLGDDFTVLDEYESERAAAKAIMRDTSPEEEHRCYAKIKNCLRYYRKDGKPHKVGDYYYILK